jgi:putative oxidoreductase
MKALHWTTWTIRILLALAFALSASGKFAGGAQVVESFDKIGLGQWFRYFTGATELCGALLLLIPALGFFGALILVATMCGAVVTHLLRIGGSPIPAIVLGTLAAFVAYRLRPGGTSAT